MGFHLFYEIHDLLLGEPAGTPNIETVNLTTGNEEIQRGAGNG